MMKSLKERLIQEIFDSEMDAYDMLMDMIDLMPEELLAQYVADTNCLPEEQEDNV